MKACESCKGSGKVVDRAQQETPSPSAPKKDKKQMTSVSRKFPPTEKGKK